MLIKYYQLQYKIKISICAFFFILTAKGYSQISLIIYDSIQIKGKISFVEIDQINNIYQVYKDEIVKLSPKGNELYRYSNKLLGNISQLDVSNSLRPLVFYKELSKIVVLDNTLSEQDNYTIKLDELGLYRALVIANSNVDNGIWMYDQDLKQILKTNTKLEITQESGNLAVLLDKSNIWPLSMIEKNGRLYIGTKNDGILIFDIYCSFLHSLKLSNIQNLQVEEENLYSWDGSKLKYYNSKNHDSNYYLLPGKYKYVLRFNNNFIGLSENRSYFYLLKELKK